MLTQVDFDQIEQLVQRTVKREIKHLPTKDEFFSRMDEVVGELKTIREEQKALVYRLTDHEGRIFGLEKIHPQGQHPS